MSPTSPLGSESRLPAAWRPWRRPSPLAERGIGIANLVGRTTARAAQLTRAKLRAGGRRLIRRAAVLRPCAVAVVGITAFRQAFDRPDAVLGV